MHGRNTLWGQRGVHYEEQPASLKINPFDLIQKSFQAPRDGTAGQNVAETTSQRESSGESWGTRKLPVVIG